MSWLTEPWSFAFFRQGMVAATLAGALAGLIGVYVVLRRMSYIGHGLSHAVLGGAAVGYVTGTSFYVTGGVWGALSALLIAGVGRSRRVGADAAIGIVTTGSYALGIALISRQHQFGRDFEAAFFGNVLAVTDTDVVLLVVVALAVAAVVGLLYKQLLFVSFDPEVASSYGVRTGVVDVIFSLVLAAAIIATMRILGVTLIAAAVVTPAVVARLTTDSFGRMLGLSVLVGALCGFGGMYLSYHADIASGATITLTATAVFAVAYVTGLLRRRRRPLPPTAGLGEPAAPGNGQAVPLPG